MAALLGGTGGGTDALVAGATEAQLPDDDAPELELLDVEEALRWACLVTNPDADTPDDLTLEGEAPAGPIDDPAAAAGLTTSEKPSWAVVAELPAAPVALPPSHSLPMERWSEPVELTPELLCIESELRHLLLAFLLLSWSSLLGMCWP